jgi:hypothetical protein
MAGWSSFDASQKKAQASGGAGTESKGNNGQRSEANPSVEKKVHAAKKPLLPSDVMEIQCNPPLDQDQALLLVPNTIYIDVRADVHPKSVSVSTGPTGTGVADAWRGFASADEPKTLPNGSQRFEITVPTCRRVSDAFQITVITATEETYSTHEGPFSCRSKAARPIKMSFPQNGDVLQVGHTYTLRWEGGDPNFPVRIVLSRFGWRALIVLAENTPNNGSFVFTVPADPQVGELDPKWASWGKNQCTILLSQPDAGSSGGTGFISIVR